LQYWVSVLKIIAIKREIKENTVNSTFNARYLITNKNDFYGKITSGTGGTKLTLAVVAVKEEF
jgi:hypothetical protein